MKGIYFESIPADIQLRKGRNSGQPSVMGATVFGSDVLKAICRYSSYDRIFLPAPADRHLRDPLGCRENRLQFLFEHEFAGFDGASHLVLMTPGTSFGNLLRIRSLADREDAPITAFIHSLHYASQLMGVLGLAVSPLRNCDALICSSRAGRMTLLNFFELLRSRLDSARLPLSPPDIELPIIPLGVETRAFTNGNSANVSTKLNIASHEVMILYFGRLSSASKADLLPLIATFAEVCSRYPAVLVLAGDDTHFRSAADLEQFAHEVGCGERIRVWPNPTTEEKLDIYARADIFVSPADSLQETFGITIVEAMAAGLPVIASDWNGYRELIDNGTTGFLVPTMMPQYSDRFNALRGSGAMKDPDILAASTTVDVRALKQALINLLSSSSLRRTYGENGKKRAAAMYDWAVVVGQYEELWATLAQRAKMVRSANTFDLSPWDYREIFAHYPTGFLENDTSLRVTKRGIRWRSNDKLMDQTAQPESWFDTSTMKGLLDACIASTRLTVSQCLQVSDKPQEDCIIRQLSHVGRLLKYGLLESVDDGADAGDTTEA